MVWFLPIVEGMSFSISYIGIAAGVFTGISGLPQLVKIVREKKQMRYRRVC